MKGKQYFITVLILGALCTISPFSIDMYLPGFPAIAKDLGTTIDQIQLSLTAYLIGIAIGQLFYGPLQDRFGRKIPLYTGLVIYILASLACAFTTSVDALIAMRFVQAIGGCAGMVTAQALVRDLFPVNKTAQAYSLLVLVIAVSPMVAPAAGGFVTAAYGWHAVFILLAIITALIMGAVYLTLPEGQLADRTLSLRPKAVLKNYQNVLKQPQFLVYMLAGGIATAAPLAYIAGSSDVFMNIYQVSEKEYGWIFALLASAMIGSTQLNHILLRKFKSEQIIRFTLFYQTAVGLLLVAGTMYGWYGKTSLIALLFVFLTGQGLTNPNATALSLAPFSKHAGSASALLGSFRMAMGGLASAAVSILHNHTALPMVSIMALCAVTGLGLFLIGDSTLLAKLRQQEYHNEAPALSN